MTAVLRVAFTLAGACAVAVTAGGCAGDETTESSARPTRGIVLVSLGNLGAAHLGVYGSPRPTSPFFDRLAERGALFEHAIAPSPSTLVSNASLFTGLYPQQHGVAGPRKAIAPELSTLPERFSHFGYRTAGFTEGGFVSRHFGFHRGFDRFDDTLGGDDGAVERTFARGLDFLRALEPGEPFFVFLHSRSVAAPYEPPAPYDEIFPFPAGAPGFAPTRANLRRADRGFLAADAATAERFAVLYDAGVAYLDGILESFFTELDRLGLAEETTVVITSDHGEEFLEHGGLGPFQVYPETIQVPLLILHPDLPGRRVPGLAQLIDIAPTLYDLADLPPGAPTAGRSLVPRLLGTDPAETLAFAETAGSRLQRTLLRHREGVTHQLVVTSLPAERDGTWISRRAALEVSATDTPSVVSFHRERSLRWHLDSTGGGEMVVGTRWMPLDLGLPAGSSRHRLDLATDGCDSPREIGLSDDPRCLSLKLRGVDVRLVELFDLAADPQAQTDLAAANPELRRELEMMAADLVWSIVTPAQDRPLTAEAADALRAAGYLD